MPRYRGTNEAAATLVGQLLILIARGKETSASLAERLGISSRQVNRYIRQLIDGGWHIERVGVPTKGDYWFRLKSPKVKLAARERMSAPGEPGSRRRELPCPRTGD